MKIKEMFKKLIAGMGVFFVTVATKVFAAVNLDVALMYGIEPPKMTLKNYIFQVCQWLIIPLTLIIGIIFFLQKRRKTKSKALKNTIIILTSIFIIVLLTYIFLYNKI